MGGGSALAPGCATGADACDLGWAVNDIRVVANNDFIAEHPDAAALLEAVEIPLADIAAQNAEMNAAGGSYTELYAMDFAERFILMGHDGPFHIGIAQGKPILRGLGLYHGKRGYGVSVEAQVKNGPVTILGLTQTRDGRLKWLTAEGWSLPGDILRIGALPRHAAILASPVVGRLFPIFHDAERVIADPVVRNRGTLGGSLCQADPAEDSTTVCDVLEAEVVIERPAGRRTILCAHERHDTRRAERPHDRGGQVVGTHFPQPPLHRPPDGRARGRDDDSFRHAFQVNSSVASGARGGAASPVVRTCG